MSRPARILAWILGTLASLAVAAVAAAWLVLRASLPDIDGATRVAGLRAPVAIERDAAGVPVIRGASRVDVARATGYAHAQDRLFQMDLLRRTGAGELAALLGAGLLDADRAIRTHQFRSRAREALALLADGERALLEAYAEGVNAGIASLGTRPFEYWLLGQSPVPWRAEDSLLVVHAMWIDLQGLDDADEQQRGRLAAALPEAAYRLLVEPDASSEAPLDGSRLPEMPMPAPEAYDLRTLDRALFERLRVRRRPHSRPAATTGRWPAPARRAAARCSRTTCTWACACRTSGIARDSSSARSGIDVSGVTLPGVPAIIAGSNRRVAWGFTNSYGDFQDLVRLEPGAGRGNLPHRRRAARHSTSTTETIEVAGGEPVALEVRGTIWGPVIGEDGAGTRARARLDRASRGRDRHGAARARAGARSRRGRGCHRRRRHARAERHDRRCRRAHRLGAVGPASAAPGHRRAAPVALARGRAPAGTAGCRARSLRACSIRRRATPGARMRASSAARHSRGSATATTRPRRARGRSATASRRSSARRPPTCWPSSSTTAPTTSRAGSRSCCARSSARAEAEAARLVAGWSGHAADRRRGLSPRAGFRAQGLGARIPHDRGSRDRALARLMTGARRSGSRRLPGDIVGDAAAEPARSALRGLGCVARRRRADVPSADLPRALRRASRTAAGVRSTPRASGTRSARPCRRLRGFLDMPAEPLPGDWSVPRVQSSGFGAPNASWFRRVARPRAICHMPGGQSGHPLSPFYRAGHADWAEGRSVSVPARTGRACAAPRAARRLIVRGAL